MSSAAKKILMGSGAVAEEKDDDFATVTGLYHFDGTNGGVNGFAATAGSVSPTFTNYGAAQGSFNPLSIPDGYWSVLFPGNTAGYLSNTNNMTAVGDGDFTIEFWAMRTDTNNGGFFQYTASPLDNKSGALGLGIYNDEYYLYYGTSGALAARAVSSSGIPGQGIWFHVAYVRSSGTITIYTNGTAVTTEASTTNYTDVSFTLGGWYSSSFLFGGYISNFRVVKGTAVYTSNFTPPTTPLTAISGTILLTANNYQFADKSTADEDLTPQGATTMPPSVRAFSPFAPPEAYDVTTAGGSAFFSGDDVISSNAAIAMTGEFSISGWIYPQANGSYSGILGTSSSSTYLYNMNYTLAMHSGNLDIFQSTGGSFYQSTIGTPKLFSWNHFAISKDSSKLYGYLNGVKNLETTNITNAGANALEIGRFYNDIATYYYTGYLSDLRLVDGSALYTGSSVTVPTSLSTSVSNTDLLMHFEKASIFDSSANHDVEVFGTAQLSTAQKKFGTASLLLNGGTSDFIHAKDTEDIVGPFTIECWAWADDTTNAYMWCVGQYELEVGINGSTLRWWDGGYRNAFTSGEFTTSTWHHVALVRDTSNVIKLYLNGTASSTTNTTTDTFAATNGVFIVGGEYATMTTVQNPWDGYVDELRISRFARYTSNFTPPTEPFFDK